MKFPFRKFVLSRTGYKANWTVSDTKRFNIIPENNGAKAELALNVGYMNEYICIGYFTNVTATDEAGVNSITLTVVVVADILGKEFYTGNYPSKKKTDSARCCKLTISRR